jgi:hypothetical protein
MTRPILTSIFLLCAICCRPAADGQPDVDSSAPRPGQPGNYFDPATASPLGTVAGLVLDSIERQRTPSGEWVGSAWFSGTVSLTGETFGHPDGDSYPYPCFEADTSSATRLPRWSGDSRRPWFCFENNADAKARLGTATGMRKSIVIDHFTVHRSLSDAVNSARLIAVVPDVSGMECFSTRQSILARQPGSVASGPPGLTGGIRLARSEGAESRLVDSDGRSLGATWRTIAGDSIVIVGRDDFLRVELRLARTPRGLSGIAVAHSDAAVERDSAGRATPFRRQWALEATPIRC